MEYLILIFCIIAGCIIAVGAFLTFIFFQWLKIIEILNYPEKIENYIELDDWAHVLQHVF